MRTAILGAGSLGIIIGALIAKGGEQVELIDVDAENVKALNEKGATVTGGLDLNVPISACTPDNMHGTYDLVILLTKQVSNKQALSKLLPNLKADSTVCTLQNGIPEELVAELVGAERTIGGTVGFGATWLGPGVSAMTSTMDAMKKFAFDIGELNGKVTERLLAIQKILSHVGHTQIVENLTGIRWSKLLMNATFSGMSAACGCNFGKVLDDDRAMFYLSHIADETVRTAHACKVDMAYMQDFDFNLFELISKQSLAELMPTYKRIWGQHRLLKASMLQDMEKGRPCEIDYINGHVCKKGREVGVETPVNDLIVSIVTEAQNKKLIPDFAQSLKALSQLDSILK